MTRVEQAEQVAMATEDPHSRSEDHHSRLDRVDELHGRAGGAKTTKTQLMTTMVEQAELVTIMAELKTTRA